VVVNNECFGETFKGRPYGHWIGGMNKVITEEIESFKEVRIIEAEQ
jgi:hypothetical protein